MSRRGKKSRTVRDELKNQPRWRLAILGLLMAGGFMLLGLRLHRVQIRQAHLYAGAQNRQSIRRVLLPAPRGRIFDRHGLCLADNRPNYCLAVYVEELRRRGRWQNTIDAVDAELDNVARYLGVPRQITREQIAQHVRKRLPLPLLAWQNLDARAMARYAEALEPMPGIDIYVQPERVYPRGTLASHLLGYVGRDRPAISNEVYHYDVMGMRGRAGLEAMAEARLGGLPGGQLIRVDAIGYKHDAWPGRAAVPGEDLRLTLDAGIQRTLERLLAGRRGAGVVLDPRNGDVLAMASLPGFDPNLLSPAISRQLWSALNRDRDRPLFNRAISGCYPPGSIFKPVVALAALEHGLTPSFAYECTGAFALGRMRLRCWSVGGHGPLDMRRAIEQSCNPYFCNLGVTLGLAPLRETARGIGLGAPSGIDLPGEAAGLLPSDAWKRRVQRDAWRAGDTANISIGQGQLLVTPLQMAVCAATLANGGRVYRPRLIADPARPEGELLRDLGWSRAMRETVRGGMRDVVHAQHGTGKRAAVEGLTLAGKTGTAEYGAAGDGRKHTWMVAFAPFEAPSVALALLVEDGESGGITVAPLVHDLLQAIMAPATPAGPERREGAS